MATTSQLTELTSDQQVNQIRVTEALTIIQMPPNFK